MRCLRVLLSLGLCLVAGTVLAEPDTFLLGNGQHGALLVQQADTVLNLATALTAPATVDSKTLSVADSAGFAAGELVLVLEVYSEGPAPEPGTPGPVELDIASGAGRWEFARLESVGTGVLNLTAPLVSAFSSPGSQVIRVPEYTSVHVLSSASIVAVPWDGSSGGVIAFLATDAVLNQGMISAGRRGLPGRRLRGQPHAGHRVHGAEPVRGHRRSPEGRGRLQQGASGSHPWLWLPGQRRRRRQL